MKKTLMITLVSGLVLSSCLKTRTCTCKDPSGNVVARKETTSSSRSEIKKFEDDCKNAKNVYTSSGTSGSSSQTIPCEVE